MSEVLQMVFGFAGGALFTRGIVTGSVWQLIVGALFIAVSTGIVGYRAGKEQRR